MSKRFKFGVHSIVLTVMILANSMQVSLASEQMALPASQNNLKLVGSAKLSVLFWDVYQSSLYSSTGDYHHEKRPEQVLFNIHYLRDIERQELIEHTEEQWQHLGLNSEQYQHYLTQLQSIWPNIEQGDSLTLAVEQSKSTFYYNKEVIGHIDSADFGPMFLNIWLSPETSRPKLRSQLLGKKDTQ